MKIIEFINKISYKKITIGMIWIVISMLLFIIAFVIDHNIIGPIIIALSVLGFVLGIRCLIQSNSKIGEYIKCFIKVFIFGESDYYEVNDDKNSNE